MKELSGGDIAICFFNDEDVLLPLQINWKHFYILDGKYEVRDIWNMIDFGTTEKEMEFEVASHDALLLRLTKIK